MLGTPIELQIPAIREEIKRVEFKIEKLKQKSEKHGKEVEHMIERAIVLSECDCILNSRLRTLLRGDYAGNTDAEEGKETD